MKEIEKGHNEEAKILLRKLHSSQTGYLSRKRKDDSEDGNKNTKGAAKSHGEVFLGRSKTEFKSRNF